MIKIICGGKKFSGWADEARMEYEKRLRRPFDVAWEYYDEEKLARMLADWPFSGRDYVIAADERGVEMSSPEFAKRLERTFVDGLSVVILVGGAYGFDADVRERADMVWSFSQLVFPHMLFRVMLIEQIYRAQEISGGGKYHHE